MHEAVTPPDFIPEAVQQPYVDDARRSVASRTDHPARPRVHAARHVGSATAVRRERPSRLRSEPPARAAVSAGPEPASTALVAGSLLGFLGIFALTALWGWLAVSTVEAIWAWLAAVGSVVTVLVALVVSQVLRR